MSAPVSQFALEEQDYRLLDHVEKYLARGIALKRWWEALEVGSASTESFPIQRAARSTDSARGFFGEISSPTGPLPVMGCVQRIFCEQARSPSEIRRDSVGWLRTQLREFVLRYFMRISDFREPEYLTSSSEAPTQFQPHLLNWCSQPNIQRRGFGFSQLFFKAKDSGKIGEFPEEQRYSIIDLRDLGSVYEWIVAKVRIYDFTLRVHPVPNSDFELRVPLDEQSYLILSREFITDSEPIGGDVAGEYGLGYAFVKNLSPGRLAYGPGAFDAACKSINFSILRGGEIFVRHVFVANRPAAIVNLRLDPLRLGLDVADAVTLGLGKPISQAFRELLNRAGYSAPEFDPVSAYIWLLNTLTMGQAGPDWCVRWETLERQFLAQHLRQQYQAIIGSLATWRQIPDWLTPEALPQWVRDGVSA